MSNDCMLTTTDNPWDPCTQFDEWFQFDEVIGAHHTCGYLALVSEFAKKEFNLDEELAIDVAMEMIINEEPELYKKVENKK